MGGGTAGALALDAPLQIVGAMGGTGTLLCAGLLWCVNMQGLCCMFKGILFYCVVAIFHIKWCIRKP